MIVPFVIILYFWIVYLIIYCIDEIKYYYLKSLVYSNSSETELINRLINELSPRQTEHNKIDISAFMRYNI